MPEVLLFSMRHMRLLGKKRCAVRNSVPVSAVDIVIDVEFCIEFHIAFYIMICIAFYIAHRIFLMLVLLFLVHRNLIIWEISDASQMCCIFNNSTGQHSISAVFDIFFYHVCTRNNIRFPLKYFISHGYFLHFLP